MNDKPDAAARAAGSRSIAEALAYLGQCRESGRSFAVLIADSPRLIDHTLRRFASELPRTIRVVRTLAPTDSAHAVGSPGTELEFAL